MATTTDAYHEAEVLKEAWEKDGCRVMTKSVNARSKGKRGASKKGRGGDWGGINVIRLHLSQMQNKRGQVQGNEQIWLDHGDSERI